MQVIAADYEDVPSVTHARSLMRMRDKMMEAGSYSVNSEAYGASASCRQHRRTYASFLSRSLLLAGVRLYPLQYNPATRTLRKYTRIVVEVSYGQRTTRPLRTRMKCLSPRCCLIVIWPPSGRSRLPRR